jgi:hypothetical protein
VWRFAALRPGAPEVIISAWQEGRLVDRVVLPAPDGNFEKLARARVATVAYERVVGESGILSGPPLVFAFSLAAGRDGVKATLAGRTAYVTPDDLLAGQGYDRGIKMPEMGLSIGADEPYIYSLLAQRFETSVAEVKHFATLRRIRVERTLVLPATDTPQLGPDAVTPNLVHDGVIAAARFLARGVRGDGRFRYIVDAPTNKTLGGYDWPRHAGATYFLAQSAAISHEPEIAAAALRSAALLRDKAIVSCGDNRCVADDTTAELGSSALAVIAFAEIVRTGLDPSYAQLVADLARFVRAQQRSDGEFMHEYERNARHPIDRQFLYYSGEASLALARTHLITKDPADLAAASRGLAHLVGPAWSFFGNRYYFGEEHWTCQVMADLWNRAPSWAALDFCERWHAYGRAMQFRPGETPYDADGAYGATSVVLPRLTPVGSRCEAAVATLDVARRVGHTKEAELLDAQLRRSLALLLRHQFRPGPVHLFADPAAVHGGMPGSEVDWQLRIDYAQHAGSAMIRWLDLTQNP